MRLDLSVLHYLTTEDFRVLTAIEMGMRNHEIVPVTLIEQIAKLKRGNTFKTISNLLKHKLIMHDRTKYDGYCLNYLGYDFLALNVLMKRKILITVGSKIGVGKESDVFLCYINPDSENIIKEEIEHKGDFVDFDENFENKPEPKIEEEEKQANEQGIQDFEEKENDDENIEENLMNAYKIFGDEKHLSGQGYKMAVLKIARLGRTSFRAVRTKRDYLKNRTQYNWLYLSRLSAESEFKFMKALYNFGFPVPKPYDGNRHIILMEFIPSFPLCNINTIGEKEKAFNELIQLIMKLASCGLVHGDFNEFNILLTKEQKIYLIDFPQMISVNHPDAKEQFDRDVEGIFNYFMKKYHLVCEDRPDFKDINVTNHLDIELKASGYNAKFGIKEDEEDENEEAEEEEDGEEEDEEEDEIDPIERKKILKELPKKKKPEKKTIEDLMDCLDLDESHVKASKFKENLKDLEQSSIKENVKKVIKKYTKVNFKSNRFKNKKTAKEKNQMI